MKIRSLLDLAQLAKKSFQRFPLSILSSFTAVCIGIYMFESHGDINNLFPFINVMLCTALGISFFFCIDVYAENKLYTGKAKYILRATGIVILIGLYFTFPGIDATQNTSVPYIRYGVYSITIHLLVAFIPFLRVGRINGFWHYNRILFVRFLTALLYSSFLYGGLALALGSLDFLFDVDLHDELFFDLFVLIGGFFNTWFFVSGIPHSFDDLDEIREYPKGIKVFSQFILLPLLILYLLILYGYFCKIIVLWSWPRGIVSYLIACVSVLGILTLLLIHPYGDLPGNAWIKKFTKAYYFILIPLIVLLFIAIGMRVSDYGITINRYAILLLGIWLTIVCTYFIFGKGNIKFIPISLACLLVFVSFGYWGMFSVSERSQAGRVRDVLESSNLLPLGKIKSEILWRKDSLPILYAIKKEDVNDGLVADSLHDEIMSILAYLDAHHGFSSIRDLYRQNLDSINRLPLPKNRKGWYTVNEPEIYMRTMGLKFEYKYSQANVSQYPHFYSASYDSKVISTHNYDYLVSLNHYYYDNQSERTTFTIDTMAYTTMYATDPNRLIITGHGDTVAFDINIMANYLLNQYKGMRQTYSVPDEKMTVYAEGRKLKMKLVVGIIDFDIDSDSVRINSIQGNLLIKNLK